MHGYTAMHAVKAGRVAYGCTKASCTASYPHQQALIAALRTIHMGGCSGAREQASKCGLACSKPTLHCVVCWSEGGGDTLPDICMSWGQSCCAQRQCITLLHHRIHCKLLKAHSSPQQTQLQDAPKAWAAVAAGLPLSCCPPSAQPLPGERCPPRGGPTLRLATASGTARWTGPANPSWTAGAHGSSGEP